MKFVTVFCLSLSVYWSFAQENGKKITLSFENATLKEVITSIQDFSDYDFFYLDEWFGSKTVSGNYNEVPLENVLDDIFRDMPINYYVMQGQKVILTNGSVIYDALPENFFKRLEESSDSIVIKNAETVDVFPILDTENREPDQEK